MGCSTLLGEKGEELGQNLNGPLLQELAVGNSIHLNLIRDSQKKGGGSTHNTRWSERRLKIAVNIYTIGYKYTQLRIDGKRLLQVLSSYAVMRYTTMLYTS